MEGMNLVDSYGRTVDYLRLSVTDRCNLRCVYCMPAGGIRLLPPSEILSWDELYRVVRVAVSLGVRKVRLTGGEPLVRGGIVEFTARLSALPGIEDLALTTNGVGLPEHAAALRAAGLRRVNVSLDTLRPERYAEITRRDLLPKALEGIDAALAAGLAPVKINVVLLHGLPGEEVDDFLAMAREKAVEIRFIERMPIGCSASEAFVSADGVRGRILSLPGAREAGRDPSSAAVRYEVPGFAGSLGVISPVSHRFCSSCNRLRLTARGALRNCLFGPETVDLLAPLRSGAPDEEIARLFRLAVATKPEGHDLPGGGGGGAEPMSRVGG
jgi:cyclic pyranopterin phosphate synthase